MSDLGGLTVRHRRLATELRRLRNRAGLTGEQVANALGWSVSKVSRMEHGRISFKPDEVKSLLALYGVRPRQRDELLSLTSETRRKSWLETQSASMSSNFTTHISMEADARIIWNWEPYVVPGLLQTEDYARSIFEAWRKVVTVSPAEIQRRIDIRLARQERLFRDPPVHLSVVLDEAVLTRRVGNEAIMYGQLKHLLELAQSPNIEIRVQPLDTFHPVLIGSFVYMNFTDSDAGSFNDVVSFEHLTNNYYIEDEGETYQYRLTFECLAAESCSPQDSQQVIRTHVEDLWTRP